MPTFPAAKLMNGIVGIDVHKVMGVPVTPYAGFIFLWHTPQFPKADVFINGMPACAVGAMGYSAHIPGGVPLPETPTNCSYWQRWKSNIVMGLVLMGLVLFANMAIAAIASLIPKPPWAEDFLKEVTGIDTSKEGAFWESVKANVSSWTKFSAWGKLLMPPIPWPGAQASTAVGSPNVQVNGGPMAFCLMPLCATSCTDFPFVIVPNAMALGFSNVMVGVSVGDLVKGIAVQTAKSAVASSIGYGMSRLQGRKGGG
jgi:hypothetical protein